MQGAGIDLFLRGCEKIQPCCEIPRSSAVLFSPENLTKQSGTGCAQASVVAGVVSAMLRGRTLTIAKVLILRIHNLGGKHHERDSHNSLG